MEKTKKQFKTDVDTSLCKACGYCRSECPRQVFAQGEEINNAGYRYMVAIHTGNCIGCQKCVSVCPDFAISVQELNARQTIV